MNETLKNGIGSTAQAWESMEAHLKAASVTAYLVVWGIIWVIAS